MWIQSIQTTCQHNVRRITISICKCCNYNKYVFLTIAHESKHESIGICPCEHFNCFEYFDCLWGEQDMNEVKTSFQKKNAQQFRSELRSKKTIHAGSIKWYIYWPVWFVWRWFSRDYVQKVNIYNFCSECGLMWLIWPIYVTDVGFYCMLSVLFDTCPF